MATKKKPTQKSTATQSAKPGKAAGPAKAAKNKPGAKGKRYNPAERKKILTFVEKVNAEKGRGGATAASKKFKVSQLTIGNWLKKARGAAPGKVKAKAMPKRRGGGGRPKKQSTDVLDQMVALRDEIKDLERQLAAKQAQFNQLKGKL